MARYRFVRREFVGRDDNVLTTLTAVTYPYGGGRPNHGVQITVKRDEPAPYANDEPYQCLRLPRPKALALARWILRQYGQTPARRRTAVDAAAARGRAEERARLVAAIRAEVARLGAIADTLPIAEEIEAHAAARALAAFASTQDGD